MATDNIIQVDNNNFMQEVETSGVPVLVDFWAPWCGPCRAVAPILEQLATKYEGKIKVGKVNVDENPVLASKFKVMSIPTLLLFKEGQLFSQVVGLKSLQELETMIKKAMD